MSHATAKHADNMDDLKDSAVAVKDAVADLAGEASRYARHKVSDAREAVTSAVDTVKSKAEDYNDNVVSFIKKNPYKSLAIAAGIGLAVGYMLRRR